MVNWSNAGRPAVTREINARGAAFHIERAFVAEARFEDEGDGFHFGAAGIGSRGFQLNHAATTGFRPGGNGGFVGHIVGISGPLVVGDPSGRRICGIVEIASYESGLLSGGDGEGGGGEEGDVGAYFWMLGKMLQGLVSTRNLSGPITIAKIANQTAVNGLESFLGFIALVSISLGVLNLLPIPMLDGGHLLYFLIEGVTGKPVSEQIQTWGLQIGMVFLVGIMMLAFYNDLLRL